jgi:hypothetical protein
MNEHPTTPQGPGRPSDYNETIADLICGRMICGYDDKPESLRSICRDDGMPALGTVMRWLAKHPEFREQYRAAREAQAEVHQEELLEISDNCTDDVQFLLGTEDEGAIGRINHSAIARAKLQVDTRKWIMSKMQPKKYGDKTVLSNDPENPVNPTPVTVTVTTDLVKSIVQQVRDEF